MTRTSALLLAGFVSLSAALFAVGIWVASSGNSSDERSDIAPAPLRLAIDMEPTGNAYDEKTNSMVLGPTDYCLESAAGDNNAHTHIAHLVVTGIEDLVGWQVRLNYEGDKVRLLSANSTPFLDQGRGQNVSFLNLPTDPTTGVHRDIISASTVPPAGPGAQTALIAASYAGDQNEAVSPDTPAKEVPDDSSYNAPTGGVLAQLTLQIAPGQAEREALFIDVDNRVPNEPGTSITVFTPGGATSAELDGTALGDGFHGEGAPCLLPGAVPTVDTTATPIPPLIIRGREISLPPGMFYKEVAGTWCNPPCPNSERSWYIQYDPDPDPQESDDSWLVFDQDYHLMQNEILPEDRDLFEPIFDALDPPYDPFASPPAYIFIKGKQVPLAPGMTYGQSTAVCDPGPCGFPGPLWNLSYDSSPAQPGDSSLTFDDSYNLIGAHILPEDQEEFQPLLDAFAAP